LLFAKKRSNLIFYFLNTKNHSISPITIKEAFELFKAEKEEKSMEVSKSFYLNYERLKEEIKKT
jgi:hypothetical protein